MYLHSLHFCYKDVIEFKEDDSEGKDVHLLVIHGSHHLLRAHVEVGTSNTATCLPLWSSTSRIQGCWGQEQLIVDSLNSHAPELTDSYLEDQLQHLQ